MAEYRDLKSGLMVEIPDDQDAQMDDAQRADFLEREIRRMTTGPIEETGRGLVRGVVKGTLGAVEAAGRGLYDIGNVAYNAARAGSLEEGLLNADLASRGNIVGEAIDEAVPAGDPTSFPARAGELSGSILGPGGLTAAGARAARKLAPGYGTHLAVNSPVFRGAEAALEAPVRAAGGALGAGTAGAAGGAATAALGGEEWRPVGELAGSIAAPIAAKKALEGAVRYVVPPMNPQHAGEIFDAQQALGITPTPGSVGSKTAGYLETAASAMPPFGGQVTKRAVEQVSRARDELEGLTSEIRPHGVRPDPSEAGIGGTLRDAAHVGMERIDRALEMLENSLTRKGGGATAKVRPTATRAGGARVATETATGDSLDMLQKARANIEADVVPVNTPAYQLAQNDLAAVRGQLDRLPVNASTRRQREALEARAAGLEAKLAGNEGIEQAKFRDHRSQVGPRTAAQKGMDQKASKPLYRAMSDDLRAHYRKTGGPLLERDFNQLMAIESRLYAKKGSLLDGRDIQTLKAILDKPDNATIYRWVAEGRTLPFEKFQLLRRNMSPGRWRKFTADFVEHMGLTSVGKQNAVGDVFSPDVFMTNWNKIGDPKLKALLFPDADWRHRMDRLATAMDGLALRQTAGNPSGTSMVAIPVALGQKAVSAFNASEGANLAKSARQIAGQLVGQGLFAMGMLSPRMAAAIAGRAPSVLERTGRALPAAAGVSAVDQQRQE